MPERVQARGDFIDGRFVLPATPSGVIDQPSPANLDDRVGSFPFAVTHIEEAVAAARRAQRGWEQTPLSDRATVLRRFSNELKRREAEVIQALGREIGKPVWEAKTEVAALISKIEITLNEGMTLIRDVELDRKLSYRFRPHGVLGVVGPFNFPLHLPHGHIVPALATGNTVVFKPSDVAPACAQLYMEAVLAGGFPPGVLNIVQGAGASGAALSAHPDVDGLLFTGSYETGCRILKANADRPGRMLALELGGKNTAIVLNDANFEQAVQDVAYSAFVTAGQRCSCVSRLVVEKGIAERFITAVTRRAGELVVGAPEAEGVFMGPLATKGGLDKLFKAQAWAAAEGAENLLATRAPSGTPRGHYATPSLHRVSHLDPTSAYQGTEIFGPDLAVFVADDLEDACRISEATPYGLSAGVFTADEAHFEACASKLRVGCLTWNAPTVGSSSRLPFGGVKNSGNHRPAALFSTLYCAYPVAVTRG